jgi:hypothetical protein
MRSVKLLEGYRAIARDLCPGVGRGVGTEVFLSHRRREIDAAVMLADVHTVPSMMKMRSSSNFTSG